MHYLLIEKHAADRTEWPFLCPYIILSTSSPVYVKAAQREYGGVIVRAHKTCITMNGLRNIYFERG